MSMRLLHHAFARLLEHDAATEWVLLQQQIRRATLSPTRRLERVFSQRSSPIERDRAEDRGMHHLVDESHLQRALGANASPRQNHVERGLQSHALRQPLRSTKTGNQTKLHFRKPECGLRVIGTNAITTGQRDFEAAAQTSTMNRRDDGSTQLLEPIEKLLAHPARALRF